MRTEDLKDEIDAFDPDEATNVEKVRMAQVALRFAIDLLDEVADGTADGHARAYMTDHLKILAGRDHGFLSRDFNLDEWIEQLERGEGDEADEN